MRIAFLILAHTDPPQLQRLLNALSDEQVSFFVHIDKKVDIRPFITATTQERNVQFVHARIPVNWGGFSIVQATLTLMRKALDAGTCFDYFVLLSGLDYPIKSKRFILEYFQKHDQREFIKYVSILEEPFLKWKISMIWFNEHVLVNRVLHRARRFKTWGKAQEFLLKRGEFLDGLEPYFGSQWWALTRNCVKYIVDFVEHHPKFVDFYRFTHGPDEMFFHTIIMNSDYAERTNQRVEHVKWHTVDHPVKQSGDYTNFTKWVPGGRHPEVLDEHDFELLEQSPCLFARKFTSAKSLKLIERVDKYLLERNSHGVDYR